MLQLHFCQQQQNLWQRIGTIKIHLPHTHPHTLTGQGVSVQSSYLLVHDILVLSHGQSYAETMLTLPKNNVLLSCLIPVRVKSLFKSGYATI